MERDGTKNTLITHDMEPKKAHAASPKKAIANRDQPAQTLSTRQWQQQTEKSPDDFD